MVPNDITRLVPAVSAVEVAPVLDSDAGSWEAEWIDLGGEG